MTTSLYLQCVLMAVIGQALQVLLIKVPSLKDKCRAANKPFTWGAWWSCDWNVVVATGLIIAAFILGLDQFLHWKPAVIDWVKWFFLGVGAFGSTIAMAKFSQYEKDLMTLLSVKSNVADSVIGTSTSTGEAKTKAEENGIDPGK